MEIRFELSKIESYSRALAEKLCNDFFSHNEAIRGEQIVKLTPIDQVNLFVLKNLFDKWKEETSKLKSPYFNYDNSEVKEALQNVVNKLSQNIYIRKEFFKPLLEKGIFDTLYLLLKPSGFFSNEFSSKYEIRLSELKEGEKFYKIHKQLVDQLIGRLDRENKSVLKGAELYTYTEALLRENIITDFERDQYLDQFSRVLKLEGISSESPMPVVNEIKPVPLVKPVVEEEKKPVVQSGPIINEKYVAQQVTVNDLLKQNLSTLAEKMSKSKIENIRGAISLSQKFLFINALFKGASADYEKALSEIDQCQNYDQALNLLHDSYASRYQWDFNQYEVKEFVEIVERKFS